ncbi:hypothetical protein PF003_g9069 [Phytophthora fragariae]|nr:hypothetical protein PF003_g9069 [Phytophthora fragariae]
MTSSLSGALVLVPVSSFRFVIVLVRFRLPCSQPLTFFVSRGKTRVPRGVRRD